MYLSHVRYKKGCWGAGGAHLCPLPVGLHHENDTRVWLVQRVSVQQGFARHTQLYFGDTGGRTAEAGRRGDGLQNIIHPGPQRVELPTSQAVQCGRSGGWDYVVLDQGISAMMWHAHRRQALLTWWRCGEKEQRFLVSPGLPKQTQSAITARQSVPLCEEYHLTSVMTRDRAWSWWDRVFQEPWHRVFKTVKSGASYFLILLIPWKIAACAKISETAPILFIFKITRWKRF